MDSRPWVSATAAAIAPHCHAVSLSTIVPPSQGAEATDRSPAAGQIPLGFCRWRRSAVLEFLSFLFFIPTHRLVLEFLSSGRGLLGGLPGVGLQALDCLPVPPLPRPASLGHLPGA